LARRSERPNAEASALAVAAEIEQRLGKVVYGRGSDTLPEVVAAALRKRGLTLGLAESCTGGLLAALLTENPASDYFLGSIVSYANSVKQAVLGVPSAVLDSQGAVSEAVVVEMATRARRVLGSDCALAISGIAGPSGGTDEKPVGLVHFALSAGDVVQTAAATFSGNRRQVQHRAAFYALDLLGHFLNASDA
jgi:nicotinamide-nucleotide amidase